MSSEMFAPRIRCGGREYIGGVAVSSFWGDAMVYGNRWMLCGAITDHIFDEDYLMLGGA